MKEESEKAGLKLQIQNTKIMAFWFHHFMANEEKVETVSDFTSWAPKSMQNVMAAMKLKDACSLEEKLWQTYKAY